MSTVSDIDVSGTFFLATETSLDPERVNNPLPLDEHLLSLTTAHLGSL